MSGFEQVLGEMSKTYVTKTVHQAVYPAISPSRPELSQAGRVVLVTGGGTGVGYAIARAFIRAAADTVIIVGRRPEVLEAARSRLEQEAKTFGIGGAKVITRTCDLTDVAQVEALWKNLAAQGITVDVLIANAAKSTERKSMLELGADEVWSQFEANAKAPLYVTEKFCSQPGEKQRFLVNVSSAVIHMTGHHSVAQLPAYSLTKMAGTFFFQLLAQEVPVEKLQVLSFHPGLIYGDGWKSMGLAPELFDTDELPGAFAVWAASKQAAFLHGRCVWANWDVDELSKGEVRKRIDEDFYYLRASIVGANDVP